METYNLSHFPASVRIIHIALFQNVINAAEIRKRLRTAATTDGEEGARLKEEVDFGFIEGSLIVSRDQLLTTIQTTLLNSLTPEGELQTRSHNLHSELLLWLSPNNNITDSIRRHGISDKTKSLIVVRIEAESPDAEARQKVVFEGIGKVVKGELMSLDKLDEGQDIDWDRIDKIYKLSEMKSVDLPQKELLKRRKEAVTSTVAIKSVA